MTTVTPPQAPPPPRWPDYPVHVSAEPVPDSPSRGLWLIKWLLIVPHLVVLLFLWAAFFVLSVVAFFAILFTARYPRALFDFNVGVLRWSWRVAYYSYGVLGTDRYPPFTLRDDPTYPARLDVDYPEQLSRGLVLVKWWLLVLPHFLIIAVFTDAGTRIARETAGVEWAWEGGLVALLVLIVGVALLFLGRHPQGLYDLLVGLNRWIYRVAGYAGLMTDVYPPFRLDQGGGPRSPHDPSTPPAAPGTGSHWTAGRVTAVAAGSLAVLLGLGLASGAALLEGWRDDDFVTSPARTVETAGYAVTTEEMLLEGTAVDDAIGQIRVRAESSDGTDLFVGIADSGDAEAYLDGIAHTVLTGRLIGGDRQVAGEAPGVAPQDAGFWVDSAAGPGRQAVVADARPGTWTLVIMAADATPGLRASVDVGATLPWLPPAGALLPLAAALLLGGGAVVWLGVRAATAT